MVSSNLRPRSETQNPGPNGFKTVNDTPEFVYRVIGGLLTTIVGVLLDHHTLLHYIFHETDHGKQTIYMLLLK